MKTKILAISIVLLLIASTLPILSVRAVDVTLTLPDAELATQFAKGWGPGVVTGITDTPGPGVRFDFNGLLPGSGTDVSDNYPVSPLAGGALDNIGGRGNFQAFTQYRLVFTNLGPNPVNVNLEMNTGWTNIPQKDTYWGSSWVSIGVGESKAVMLDFSSVGEVWNAQDDPMVEWRYPGGTSGVAARRLDEVSRLGFQVLGNGAGSIVVSQTIPSDTVVALSDEEMTTQFAKETGPATVSRFDILGSGVRFDFIGLSGVTGTTVGDNFAVSALAGGAWKDYGSGFAGPYDFSGYGRYTMMFTNVGPTTLQVNLIMNTGWTNAPWGSPAADTFWQNGWTTLAPGESRFVTLDFWSAQVYNAVDDPVGTWRYADGTTGLMVRRLDEVSNIGFQVLGGSDGSIIVSGDTTLSLSDAEMTTQFGKEYGPGTVSAILDIPGPGVRFDFTGLNPSSGTTVGDNFAVSPLAGGTYKTYGVINTFSTCGDFSGYTKYQMMFTNVGPNPVTVNLKLNTGWTTVPPEYAAAWRDTFYQNSWTSLAVGETKTVTLDFSSAQIYNAGDEQEFKVYSDGTTGVAVWRLDEASDIGFQVLGNGAGSIIVASRIGVSTVYVDDGYTDATPGWGYDHFAKIQDGIDAVVGSTVIVYPGTYNEEITISRAMDVIGTGGADSTIIDGTGVTLVSAGLVKITATSGSVLFSGFTVRNAPAAGTTRIGILTRSSLAGPTYTISYNKIYGSNDPDEWDDYGFYASYGKEDIVFTHNLVTETGANNIVLEVHTGSTEISDNTLDAGVYGADTIFFMTYGGADVMTLQNVTGNTFDMGTGVGPFDYAHRATGVSFNSPGAAWGLGDAKWTNILITKNAFNNLRDNRRGIGFWNSNPAVHNIFGPQVIGNTINGAAGPRSVGSFGIDTYGLVDDLNATCNTIKNVDTAIAVRWTGGVPGASIHYNNIYNNTKGLDNMVGAPTVDARYNWWGSATGPYHSTLNPTGTGNRVSDYVNFDPWMPSLKVTPFVHDVAVTKVLPVPLTTTVGTPVDVKVTVKNEGNLFETITVTAYYDAVSLGPQVIVDLAPGASKTISFMWATTGMVEYHDYIVSATADQVLGETHTADNTKSSGWPVIFGAEVLLRVEPSSYRHVLFTDETFKINVTMNNLNVGWKAVGVNLRLGYDPTLIELIEVTEGPFIRSVGDTFFVTWNVTSDTLYGPHVGVAIQLMPQSPGEWTAFPQGSGIIVTLTFRVKTHLPGGFDGSLYCGLNLMDTVIVYDDTGAIPHRVENSYYENLPTNIGDVNYDGLVDIRDLALAAKSFGAYIGHPKYNPVVDVNKDGECDIRDLARIAKNYGWRRS